MIITEKTTRDEVLAAFGACRSIEDENGYNVNGLYCQHCNQWIGSLDYPEIARVSIHHDVPGCGDPDAHSPVFQTLRIYRRGAKWHWLYDHLTDEFPAFNSAFSSPRDALLNFYDFQDEITPPPVVILHPHGIIAATGDADTYMAVPAGRPPAYGTFAECWAHIKPDPA